MLNVCRKCAEKKTKTNMRGRERELYSCLLDIML